MSRSHHNDVIDRDNQWHLSTNFWWVFFKKGGSKTFSNDFFRQIFDLTKKTLKGVTQKCHPFHKSVKYYVFTGHVKISETIGWNWPQNDRLLLRRRKIIRFFCEKFLVVVCLIQSNLFNALANQIWFSLANQFDLSYFFFLRCTTFSFFFVVRYWFDFTRINAQL